MVRITERGAFMPKVSTSHSTRVILFLVLLFSQVVAFILGQAVALGWWLRLIIMIGSILLVFWFFSKLYEKPVRKLSAMVEELAHGDLFAEVKVPRGPAARIALPVQKLQAALKGFFGPVTQLALKVNEAGSEISKAVDEIASSANQVSASSSAISATNQEQAATAEKMSHFAQTLNIQANQVAEQTQVLAPEIERAARAVEQGKAVTLSSTHYLEAIEEEVRKTVNAAESLLQLSRGISGMAGLIGNLAKQTDLLALNAAIEAARANQEGNGFNVVAAQVKKLANRSADTVTQIRATIAEVESGIVRVRETSSLALDKTEAGVKAMKEAGGLFEAVSDITSKVVASFDEVVSVSRGITYQTQEFADAIEQLSANAKEVALGSQEISVGLEQQSQSIDGVVMHLQHLLKQADEMQQWVATQAMERTMWNRVQKIVAADVQEAVTRTRLQELAQELELDVVYLTDTEGAIELCTEKEFEGLNLLKFNPRYAQVLAGREPMVVTPIIRRAQDGLLYKFLVVPRPGGKGLIQISFSLEHILQLATS